MHVHAHTATSAARVDDWQAAFQSARTAFAEARRRCAGASAEWQYRFAGRPVQLRVAGRLLGERVHPSFAHLVSRGSSTQSPQLLIDLCDQTETGVAVPCNALATDAARTRPFDQGTFCVSPDDRYVVHQSAGVVSWLDRRRQHIIGWRVAGTLTLAERSKPLPLLLALWYSDQGVEIVHAALVARGACGVLIAGGGGAGKSTTALACASDGFAYLGDDHVGVGAVADACFAGYSLYASARLDPIQLQHFPQLAACALPARPPDERKALIFVQQVYPERLASRTDIGAIALPRIAHGAASRVRPASKREALLALIPSSVFGQGPSPGARRVELLARLVDRVPAYWLELGADRKRIAPAMDDLVQQAAKR